MSIQVNKNPSVTQIIAFIGGLLMFFNALFGIINGSGFLIQNVIARIILGLIGLFVAILVIVASQVVYIYQFPINIPYDGVLLIVLGVVGIFTNGYFGGSIIVIIAGILYLYWQK